MAKKIIFCADGTWNGPEGKRGILPSNNKNDSGELVTGDVTNVVKLFANLAGNVTPESLMLRNEQEKIFADKLGNITQIAKYVHGVGDSSNPLVRFLGGTFGLGVIERIVRGYTFISRYYVPGDEIHIVGFSRGAYTARALAGMIAKVGLLNSQAYDPSDKAQAYRYAIAAWAKSKSMSLQGAGKLTDLATHMLNFVQGFVADRLPENGLISDIPIKSVAVWDTVGSLGVPQYIGDERFDVFRFVDTKLSDKVEYGFHAMAIDEIRRDFPVTRWDDRQKISQVWFVGAHSDVGGGYSPAESRLSDEALGWLMKSLSGLGAEFVVPLVYSLNRQAVGQAIHTPWKELPFSTFPTVARQVSAKDTLHSSVVQRWNADVAYRPDALSKFSNEGLGKCGIDEACYS